MDTKALSAEFIGTFTLVSVICAVALFSKDHSLTALTVSLTAGLAILAMTHALIDVSGAHFNPAVTLGLVAGGRLEASNATGYIIAQVLGAISAAALFAFLLSAGITTPAQNFSTLANGYGAPTGAPIILTALIEVIFTALFLIVFMGATSRRTEQTMPAIAIGLGFAALHLVPSLLTSGALNPARSTGTALFAGTHALTQLWLFWIAPVTGAIIGGLASKWLHDE